MKYTKLSDVQADLTAGRILLVDLVRHYLDNIQKKNPLINAFLEVFEEEALATAVHIQTKINQKTAGSLAGLVIGIKDNICYKDHISSAASHMLQGYRSIYSATVVERLLAADAIIIGRLNCDEFAMGGSNEKSYFGFVRNPHNTEKVPGGSSGGSAAAVAADFCLATLGTDTGGSIRQPAAFCGITGLKPSYGRVSRYGVIAYASSFDQVGPMAPSVEDCARILEVLSGQDGCDASMLQQDPVAIMPQLAGYDWKGKKIAYFSNYIENPSILPAIRENFYALIEKIRAKGALVEAIDFPLLDHLVPTYYILTTAEASSNLARYTGVEFGHQTERKVENLDEFYKFSRAEGFGEEVKRRVILGTFVLSEGNYEAYYQQAQRVRQLIYRTTKDYFQTYDCILTPTTPSVAFGIGEKQKLDPILMYLEDIFTVHANLAGIPGISLPLLAQHEGLPMGVQLLGAALADAQLMQIAYQVERLIADQKK